MKFIVLEIQTHEDGNIGTLINAYENINEAEHRYHEILSAAAISELPVHTAFFLTNEGTCIKGEKYIHEQSEPEPEIN